MPMGAACDPVHAPVARYHTLDAIRGIAALSVLIFHGLLSSPIFAERSFGNVFAAFAAHDWARAIGLGILVSPLQALWRGDQAVNLFFILSGFVLCLPFLKGPVEYGGFALRRLIRIYVPYVVAVALGVIGAATLYNGTGTPELTAAFNTVWHRPIQIESLVDQLLMLGQERHNFYDPPTWSLVHEMRASLIFPIMVWACSRFGPRGAIALLIALYGVCLTGDIKLVVSQFAHSLLQTGRYAAFFMVGILLAMHRQILMARFHLLSHRVRKALVIGGVLLWAYAYLLPLPLRDLAVVLCSGLWIFAALQSDAQTRLLTSAVPQWLGRVSYSLYLTHVLVSVGLVYTLGGFIGAQAAVIVAPLFALAFAELFYRCVERPAIEAGRHVGRAPRPAHLIPEKI